jgi:LysM repeat protein
MAYKKLVLSIILSFGTFVGSTFGASAQSTAYTVQAGDTFYLISKKFGISLTDLMKANNASESTIIYPGNILIIPAAGVQTVHTVQSGDTFYLLSKKYNVDLSELMKVNNATSSTILNIGRKLIIPQNTSSQAPASPSGDTAAPYISYNSYTVKAGDTLWSIANKHGIPMPELLKANGMTESTWLTIGQTIRIPVHVIPVKQTPGEKYGEYLDWWTEAQYVVPTDSVLEVVDFYTGKAFKVKRTTGSSHADVETLTSADSQKMKEIWGGSYSWDRRPVIVKINGRKIAASMSSYPHAGNEDAPGGIQVSWRSDNYGPGYNLDWVKNNSLNGVVDLHFANSVRHIDGLADTGHQENIKIAAGLKN